MSYEVNNHLNNLYVLSNKAVGLGKKFKINKHRAYVYSGVQSRRLLGPTRLLQSSFFSWIGNRKINRFLHFRQEIANGRLVGQNHAFSGRKKTRLKSILVYMAALLGFLKKDVQSFKSTLGNCNYNCSSIFCQGTMSGRPLRLPMRLLT